MKNIKYVIIILLLFVNINVFAICDTTKLKELKTIADNIEFTYDYEFERINNTSTGELNRVVFKINAYNLDKSIKPLIIKDYYMDDYKEFKYNSNKNSSLGGFKEGEKVIITFKAYTADECAGKTVVTRTITIPYYNWFYYTDDCLNNRDFKYCKTKLLDIKLDAIQFGEEFKKFQNEKNSNIVDDTNEKKSKFNFNYLIGLIIIITILIVLIILIILKIKQNIKKRSL